MDKLNQTPSGSELKAQRDDNKPSLPELPSAWSASALLTPFGDSVAPQQNPSQLVVASIESASVGALSWMRTRLYLTQDMQFFDFLFVNIADPGQPFESRWYWIDSSVAGDIRSIYGPFKTTLQIPGPEFIKDNDADWGNTYPLMCTEAKPGGIDCDHWVIPAPGSSNHGSWYAFRRDTNPKKLFRIFTIDSSNPMMIPILGAYFIANLPSVQSGTSSGSDELIGRIIAGKTVQPPGYWNPMITQQDIQRAISYPLCVGQCTALDIQRVLPGFLAAPPGTPLPAWSNYTYIKGWALALDLIPYFTRVFYMWTGNADSRQQTMFFGQGKSAGAGSYLERADTCLSTTQTDLPHYKWDPGSDPESSSWKLESCDKPIAGVGLPYPDWLARSGGVVRGQIEGNEDFGLMPNEILNIVATELPLGGGERTIFWAWFLASGTGMLFSEGKYLHPLSHLIHLLDYTLFERDAPITAANFTNPSSYADMSDVPVAKERIHLGKLHGTRGSHPSSRK